LGFCEEIQAIVITYSKSISLVVVIMMKVVRTIKSNFLFQSFAEYQEKIPFVNAAPIDEQEAKKQKKAGGKKAKAKQVTDGMDKMALGDQ